MLPVTPTQFNALLVLGILLPIVSIPGYTSVFVTIQWPLLLIVLGLTLWKHSELSILHFTGILFFIYAISSFFWSINYQDSIWGIMIAYIWLLSFWLGTTTESLTDLWKGLAIGLSVSSLIAIFQALGYKPVFAYEGNPGLFFNSTTLGTYTTLVIIALISHKLWYYIPLVLPGFILSYSRGAWLVVFIALIAKYLHWSVAIISLIVAAIFMIYWQSPSDEVRLQIWQIAYRSLTWFGFGAGTFVDIIYQYQGTLHHPEFVHNDYLQFVFEYGVGSIAILTIIAAALFQTQTKDWPVFVAFATFGLFYFPFHCAISAFIGCVVAGHITRDKYLLRDYLHSGGFNRLAWAS
jgi:hypothetical protein